MHTSWCFPFHLHVYITFSNLSLQFAIMAETLAHKLLERCHISPAAPPDSRETNLPLAFLDLTLAGPIYVRRLYFYHFPNPTHHFIQTTLPTLKHTLSLALQHFFPLAGNLLCPPPPAKPFIHCTGDDSVPLTVLESNDDLNHLIANNCPKSLKELHNLVPKLTYSLHDGDDDTLVFPLLALQVTVFPNRGLCIAVKYCHVMDGRSCSHFMKSWASICKTNGNLNFLEKSAPFYDRQVIKDTKGLEAIFLKDYFNERSTWKENLLSETQNTRNNEGEDMVKATIVFTSKHIKGLKEWVLNQRKNNGESNAPYLSKFAVTCALVWVSLAKTRFKYEDAEQEEEKEDYFRFAADCRNRFEYPIPATYFGNCITRCHAVLKRKELKGEEGFMKAVKAIVRAITDMKNDPFEGADKWKDNFSKMYASGRSSVLVTGSPKFSVYETDFGFGRPIKVEMVHSMKCMSLAESGDEKGGGLECGLIFKSSAEFEDFICVMESGQQAFTS